MTLKYGLEITQDHSNRYHSNRMLGCGFLFTFHSNYRSLLHHLRDKARYWSKIVICSYPHCIRSPVQGITSEYCHPVWYGKTRMVGLSNGKKSLRICITVYTQYRGVTDGQTDGQTSCHGIARAMHTRRALKIKRLR